MCILKTVLVDLRMIDFLFDQQAFYIWDTYTYNVNKKILKVYIYTPRETYRNKT